MLLLEVSLKLTGERSNDVFPVGQLSDSFMDWLPACRADGN